MGSNPTASATSRRRRRLAWAMAVAALASLAAGLFLLLRPLSFEAQMARFIEDEGLKGAVIVHGAAGSKPNILTFGEAVPGRPMQAQDRFRLASLSKPITAAAVLHLVRTRRITLDTPVPEAGAGVGVRHLLQHSGGWDRARSFDPIGDPPSVSRLGIHGTYRCEDLAVRMPPTDFAPGTRYAYSNIGYCWLGQMVERVSNMDYEDYAERFILAPRGARLDYHGAPSVEHRSDWPAQAYAALGPGGGWTGTALDYWRFAAGPIDPMIREAPAFAEPGKDHYGLGWRIWPDGMISHFGAIPGAYGLVLRRGDQVALWLFNGRPADDERAFRRLRQAARAIGI